MGWEPCRRCGELRHFGGLGFVDKATDTHLEDVFECQHCGDPTYWRSTDDREDPS